MDLELKINIPDAASAILQQGHVSPAEYAREILRAHFETLALGDEGNIENRLDWQSDILTGRDEIAQGRGIPDEQVEAWHNSHLE